MRSLHWLQSSIKEISKDDPESVLQTPAPRANTRKCSTEVQPEYGQKVLYVSSYKGSSSSKCSLKRFSVWF